jgi:hypothetical protein
MDKLRFEFVNNRRMLEIFLSGLATTGPTSFITLKSSCIDYENIDDAPAR